ncbi:MAG: signal peptidase II [Clostridiales bacterium]|nr:signal peptidase II [Clostridiales bacterium]MCD8334014.1 signal peptidase II [Clostridiales bacterium]
MWYFIVAGFLVGLDQGVKAAIRASLALGEQVVLIPGVVGLTYVQNTGMAFSSFSGWTGFLTVVSLAATVALAVALAKNLIFSHPLGKWPLALVMAGAAGNFIDRLLLGYVTDMIQVLFINFAVFNIADCCVVVGGILVLVYVFFFWEKLEPKEAKGEKGPWK